MGASAPSPRKDRVDMCECVMTSSGVVIADNVLFTKYIYTGRKRVVCACYGVGGDVGGRDVMYSRGI